MNAVYDRQSNENRFSLVFKDKSSEISSASTIIDTLSRSPANPSMVCASVSVCICLFVCACLCVLYVCMCCVCICVVYLCVCVM